MKTRTQTTSKAKCAGCRAPVRDAFRVISTDDDGSQREYACLCRRCLEAEKVFARRVELFVNGIPVKEFVNTNEAVPRPIPAKTPAAA
ncbi:MAG: hypothetical protein JWO20_2325 [Candidatus Angelobacter sp.]|nr:hypothetical protein [Candidatus Angelobacter sp.]